MLLRRYGGSLPKLLIFVTFPFYQRSMQFLFNSSYSHIHLNIYIIIFTIYSYFFIFFLPRSPCTVTPLVTSISSQLITCSNHFLLVSLKEVGTSTRPLKYAFLTLYYYYYNNSTDPLTFIRFYEMFANYKSDLTE